MTAATKERPAKTGSKTLIVDADGHYFEPRGVLADYIDPKFRDMARERANSGYRTDTPLPIGANPFSLKEEAARKQLLLGDGKVSAEAAPFPEGGIDSKVRMRLLNEERMDIAVLYPTFALEWIPDTDYHKALNRALNDWLAHFCSEDPKRLYGAANIVAITDVDEAIKELTRCVKQHGMKAVFIRTALALPDDRWWGRRLDPFWAACQDLDVAVGLHPMPTGGYLYGAGRLFNTIGLDPAQQFLRAPFNHVVDAMNCLGGLLAGGVPERFPKLRFAVLESSGGWLVSYLERMDERYEKTHQHGYMKMEPSDYFRRNFWISFDPEEAPLKLTAEWLGSDRIVWGSDFPHPDAFYPDFVGKLNHNIAGLSKQDQVRISGLNAVDLYKLPVDGFS